LPSRRQRLVGAWCFLDHLKAPAGTGMQVEAHPHIGLQTFTWLLDGEIRHRDSTGSDQTVLPQQVGIMTAGRGISHTEHGSADKPLHATQLWIALSEHARQRAPEFHHHPQLPQSATPNLRLTLLVGSLNGLHAPIAVHSPLMAADLRCTADGEVRLPRAHRHPRTLRPR
jgi:pirin family protein